MNKVEESARYYQMMAARHEASGRAPNQARVYGELAALVGQCSSLEEIQSGMQAGGYYQSPAQALVLDKMLALRDAARDVGFTVLAGVYQRRHDEVAADYNRAFTTGWEQEAQRELNRIGNNVAAFNELMSAYFEFRCCHPSGQDKPLEKLRNAVATLETNGESFESVVANPYYRWHSAYSDQVYNSAVHVIRQVLAAPPDTTAAMADIATRAKSVQDAGDEKALTEAEKAYQATQRRSAYLCVAPDDAPGPYTYEHFYEDKA